MKKEKLYLKLREDNFYLEDFKMLDNAEYDQAIANGEEDLYRINDDSPICFKTKGHTELTSLEIQYRTYKCVNVIKNIVVGVLITAIAAAILLLVI